MEWALVGKVIGGLFGQQLKLARAVYDFLPKIVILALAGVLAWMLLGSIGALLLLLNQGLPTMSR